MPIIYGLTGNGTLDKPSLQNPAPGPRDRSGSAENCAAVAGNTLHVEACAGACVCESPRDLRLRGIVLAVQGLPAEVALGDYPSVTGQPDVAAAELGRSPALGKVLWFPRGGHAPDSRVCPPS